VFRKLIGPLLAAFTLASAAHATIVGPLPYTLANGQTADAAQVMANFNKIVNDVNNNVIFPSFSQQNYYAADSGAANAMAVVLSPTPSGYVAGMVLNVKVAVTNTGATTINANGLGAQSVVNLNGSTLKSQQMLAGEVAQLVYDGSQFQLTSLSPFAVRQSAVSRTTSVFTTSGNWTFTVPAGVYYVNVEIWGAGGGGGGANSAGLAAGGGAGGYSTFGLTVSPGDVLNGNVGAAASGGAAGAANNGGTGGTTTVFLNGVAQCNVTGGLGGAGSTSLTSGAGGLGSSPSGSACGVNITGQSGWRAYGVSSSSGSGFGGSAPRGGVGGSDSSGGGGNPGGGGGGANGNNAGGSGGNGWVILTY
jgi:hypothetical protein